MTHGEKYWVYQSDTMMKKVTSGVSVFDKGEE